MIFKDGTEEKNQFIDLQQFIDLLKKTPKNPDFILWLPEEYSTVEKLRNRIDEILGQSNKWNGLKSYLVNNKYIEEVSNEAFHEVMERYRTNGDRIKWTGNRRSAGWFYDKFEFKLPKFNECFEPLEGNPFRKNDYHENYSPDNDFIEFLEEYKRTISTE